jgi:hypothetical protein
MKLTKLEMARVIVTALYHRPTLVRPTNPEAIRRAKHGTVESLTRQHAMALAVIAAERETASGN